MQSHPKLTASLDVLRTFCLYEKVDYCFVFCLTTSYFEHSTGKPNKELIVLPVVPLTPVTTLSLLLLLFCLLFFLSSSSICYHHHHCHSQPPFLVVLLFVFSVVQTTVSTLGRQDLHSCKIR